MAAQLRKEAGRNVDYCSTTQRVLALPSKLTQFPDMSVCQKKKNINKNKKSRPPNGDAMDSIGSLLAVSWYMEDAIQMSTSPLSKDTAYGGFECNCNQQIVTGSCCLQCGILKDAFSVAAVLHSRKCSPIFEHHISHTTDPRFYV